MMPFSPCQPEMGTEATIYAMQKAVEGLSHHHL